MFTTSLEAALKLKEISYINAQGYPAGEMKHGPIALVDPNLAVIGMCGNQTHPRKNAQQPHGNQSPRRPHPRLRPRRHP